MASNGWFTSMIDVAIPYEMNEVLKQRSMVNFILLLGMPELESTYQQISQRAYLHRLTKQNRASWSHYWNFLFQVRIRS